jgi:chemotaxis protein methyltransferase CheR
VRIWSAAASSGQEIYSLAMIFDRLQRARRKHLVDLAASDISRASLQRGQRGLYGQSEVQRGLPIRLLVKHFEREGEGWRLSPLIRGMVRWRRINLVAPFAQVGIFEIILCRNLIGELDASFARRVLENLSLSLAPNGFLVLGSRDDPAVGGDLLRPTGARGIYKLAAARALANAA